MIYLESPLYQWDVNRKIIVLDDCITEVHFSNVKCEKAFVCAVYEEEVTNGTESIVHRVADIPNILLQSAFTLNVYAVCENQTKAKRVYAVWGKKKPDDYIYTETEVLTFKSLEDRIDEVEKEMKNIGSPTEEQIENAISIYLAKNPVEEIDPTVPDWAKQKTKPTYTAEEVGALSKDTKIPTDEYINNLINIALGGVENGSY